jgi:hypothetical protein
MSCLIMPYICIEKRIISNIRLNIDTVSIEKYI